jgi:hypothetical protein
MQVVRNGMGMMVPGAFVVPQNPIVRSQGGLGGIVGPAAFVVPQNPLMGNTILNGPINLASPKKNALTTSLKGLSCGTCAASSLNGMGSFDVTNPVTSLMDDSSFGFPNYVIAIGGVMLVMFMSRSQASSGRKRK